MSRKRYRLQGREAVALPNILGNHSFPVHTYRWKDMAVSDDYEALLAIMPKDDKHRIVDTEREYEQE